MPYDFGTRCIHGDGDFAVKDEYRSLSFPIFQTAAYAHEKIGHNASGFDYTRESNPTRQRLEEVMASLEHAQAAIAFSSGMAAISTCLELFEPQDEILCSKDLYGGVFRLHELVSRKNGLQIRYADTSDIQALERMVTAHTKAIYIETPTNPTMMVTDIAACAELAHRCNALLIVDNTFLTPCFQNPLDLGADIVIHSASKYLSGHNDTIGGFLCVNDGELGDRLRVLMKTLGNALAPFDSWLLMRGIKTLALRMKQQAKTALAIARWLERNPLVEKVVYPGLPSFPSYGLTSRQARGFGAMISFYLHDETIVEAILQNLHVITFAESLGGVESLMTYPIIQTHADTPDALKEELGINGTLLRLSVGLESEEDLIADLAQAFAIASQGNSQSSEQSLLLASNGECERGGRQPNDPFDFDTVIDRRNTYALKYATELRGYPNDVIPLWVADMDFKTAPPIIDALRNASEFGIFGYSDVDESYYESVAAWFKSQHGWRPDPGWIVKTPGVVFALAQAVHALTKPGDAVIIQPPVYYPFFSVVRENGRKLVENELLYRDGRYEIDFEDFERKIVEQDVKMFILCSPHNPVGRVWTREELIHLAEICARHQVIVVADEIHCDLTLPGHTHTMFGDACKDLDLPWISCTAPSKSFNLAGLQVSHIFIKDEDIRDRFKKTMLHNGYSQLNLLGLVAAKAAYDHGAPWLRACKDYMYGNLEYLRQFLKDQLPQLKLVEPEGTYFAWVDCSALGLTVEKLDDFIVHDAKLWLDAGHIFGGGAGQFQRIVLASPRELIERALHQLKDAVDRLHP